MWCPKSCRDHGKQPQSARRPCLLVWLGWAAVEKTSSLLLSLPVRNSSTGCPCHPLWSSWWMSWRRTCTSLNFGTLAWRSCCQLWLRGAGRRLVPIRWSLTRQGSLLTVLGVLSDRLSISGRSERESSSGTCTSTGSTSTRRAKFTVVLVESRMVVLSQRRQLPVPLFTWCLTRRHLSGPRNCLTLGLFL